MKRIFTFAIGIIVAVVVSGAHARGWLAFAETPLRDWAQRGEIPPRIVGDLWQDIFITLVSLAVAWVTLIGAVRHRVVWLVLAFLAELLALVWIGSLYHIFFQPVPCMVAAAVAYAASIGYLAWDARSRAPKPEPLPEPLPARVPAPVVQRPPEPLPARVREPVAKPSIEPAPKPAPAPPVARVPEPVIAPIPQPKVVPRAAPVRPAPAPVEPPKPQPAETLVGAPELVDTTVLVCDLPAKYDLLDDLEPAAAARAVVKFGQRASELLLKAGAHLHKVDGEGVVALFGFPRPVPEHAEKAVRAAFDLVRAFADETHGSNGDSAASDGAHVGISSGTIMAGRIEGRSEMLIVGEAIELARRFCVANRFYGSRILVGPQTFEFASNAVVARPIDFLSGVTAQERHEIYEPLALAADAPAELLARRDSFWKGVVLYREKRWAEAFTEFQKARGGSDAEDPPLNLYLRRLEPLAALDFIEAQRA